MRRSSAKERLRRRALLGASRALRSGGHPAYKRGARQSRTPGTHTMRETTTQDESADGLKSRDFTDAAEPWELFRGWMAEATASEPNDPTAMALATVDADGLPNVRMVLLKGADEDGFVFYTNRNSNKGCELAANPKAALVFHWKSLRRQVRARGAVTRRQRRRGGCLFREPPARQPHRRLGKPAVAAAREPLRLREGDRRPRRPLRPRRGAAPAVLDGLPHLPGEHRVLARSALPPARSRRLHQGRGRLDEGTALSVTGDAACDPM